jgi:hypothetical protein
MYVPTEETATPLATAAPGTGLLFPVTVASAHGPFATEMLMVPVVVTLFTYRESIAFDTLDAVVPAGNVLRSNCTRALLVAVFPTFCPPTFRNSADP